MFKECENNFYHVQKFSDAVRVSLFYFSRFQSLTVFYHELFLDNLKENELLIQESLRDIGCNMQDDLKDG